MEREVGGGIGMGNTCKPMAVSFQCMTKFTTNKKKKEIKKKSLLAKLWTLGDLCNSWCGDRVRGWYRTPVCVCVCVCVCV